MKYYYGKKCITSTRSKSIQGHKYPVFVVLFCLISSHTLQAVYTYILRDELNIYFIKKNVWNWNGMECGGHDIMNIKNSDSITLFQYYLVL